MDMKICKGIKKDGSPCRAMIGDNKDFCLFHDSSHEAQELLVLGRKLGARKRRGVILESKALAQPINNLDDLVSVLSKVFAEVRCGELSPKVGQALVAVAKEIRLIFMLQGQIAANDEAVALKNLSNEELQQLPAESVGGNFH